MSVFWVVNISILWLAVLVETGLLLLVLRTIGKLQQPGQRQTATRNIDIGGIDVGMQAPSFLAIDQHDSEINLGDTHGYKRLIAFISPGCSACGRVKEVFEAISQEMADLSLLMVGAGDLSTNREFVEQHNVTFPLLTPISPSPDSLISAYQVQTFPYAFVLDEQGYVCAKGLLFQAVEVRAMIERAFADS